MTQEPEWDNLSVLVAQYFVASSDFDRQKIPQQYLYIGSPYLVGVLIVKSLLSDG